MSQNIEFLFSLQKASQLISILSLQNTESVFILDMNANKQIKQAGAELGKAQPESIAACVAQEESCPNIVLITISLPNSIELY